MGELNAMGTEKAGSENERNNPYGLVLLGLVEKKSTVHLEAPTFLKEIVRLKVTDRMKMRATGARRSG